MNVIKDLDEIILDLECPPNPVTGVHISKRQREIRELDIQRRGPVETEAETGVVQSQSRSACSQQELEETRKESLLAPFGRGPLDVRFQASRTARSYISIFVLCFRKLVHRGA